MKHNEIKKVRLMTLFFRFVLQHLPGKINTAEIEEMIKTVDKNNDGKISYSEFRVRERVVCTFTLSTVAGHAGSFSTGHSGQPCQAGGEGDGGGRGGAGQRMRKEIIKTLN